MLLVLYLGSLIYLDPDLQGTLASSDDEVLSKIDLSYASIALSYLPIYNKQVL